MTIGILAGVLLLALLWLCFCGWQWSWGPFAKLHDQKTKRLPGNGAAYDLETIAALENSILNRKRICFLGSSVTYGSAAMGVSFADYIAQRGGAEAIKAAVPGTKLVDNGPQSYIQRLKQLDSTMHIDLLICQLSTNDATRNCPLGTVGDSFALDTLDTATVAGAIEYIIAYARETWDCPVVFFTNCRYDSDRYAAMVDCLGDIQDKWQIGVLDLWSDSAFNDISQEQRKLYMADAIHPTKAGYLLWWTPEIERQLTAYLETTQTL